MSGSYDIAIIGNGILGLTTARALFREAPDMRIALIGPNQRNGSATMAAGAMLALWGEVEVNQFRHKDLAERFKIPERGFSLWQKFADDLGEEAGVDLPVHWGTYVLNTASGTELEDRSFDYMVEALKRRQIEVEILRSHQVDFIEPRSHLRPLRVAKIPDGMVDARRVVAAFDTVIDGIAGITRFDDRAVNLKIEAGSHEVGLADGTRIKAGRVLLANGAFAQDLVDQIPDLATSVPRLIFNAGTGIDATFRPFLREQSMVPKPLDELRNVVRSLDRGGACGIHVVPYGDGRFYLGASSGSMLEPFEGATLHGLHALLGSAEQEIHAAFFKAIVQPRATGFRPLSADAFPLLGESVIPGIWFLNGTKRDGFTSSPFLSREMAKALVHDKSELPERFRPSRKLISYRNRPEAIEMTYLGWLAGDYAHGLSLPGHRVGTWHNGHKANIEALYDKRGIQEFGVHPEIMYFLASDATYRYVDQPREID